MSEARGNTVESQVPARMDRLPFSRWHVLVIAALGITWILDGLEVTIVGIVASVLTDKVSGLNLTAEQVGLAGGIYIAGAASGALFFSYLTDLVIGGGGPHQMRRAVAATTRRVAIGKAADAIVRTAPCPVLVVRGESALGVGLTRGDREENEL